MCQALVGKIAAIDGNYAIVDFSVGVKKAINLQKACLNDFVVVRGNLIIEKIEQHEGKVLLAVQKANFKKLKK